MFCSAKRLKKDGMTTYSVDYTQQRSEKRSLESFPEGKPRLSKNNNSFPQPVHLIRLPGLRETLWPTQWPRQTPVARRPRPQKRGRLTGNQFSAFPSRGRCRAATDEVDNRRLFCQSILPSFTPCACRRKATIIIHFSVFIIH